MDSEQPADLDLQIGQAPKWSTHSLRRLADTVARRDRDVTSTTEAEIDVYFGWHERILLREMQIHYAAMNVKERMKQCLKEIQDGDFAREFILEKRAGNVGFDAKRRRAAAHPMEEVGARLRSLMPWLAENRLVDRSQN